MNLTHPCMDPFLGVKVIIDRPTPKVQLQATIDGESIYSDEFRKQMNDWLAGFFGSYPPVPRGQAYKLPDGTFVVHPADYAALREAIPARFFASTEF